VTPEAELQRNGTRLLRFTSSSPTAGSTAGRVMRALEDVERHAAEAATDWEPVLFCAIREIANEYSVAGWDGHAAVAISAQVRARALAFALVLRARLPAGTPAPELIPEPDGELSISWETAPGLVFSVSVGRSDRLHYSGLFARGVEQHGVEHLGLLVPSTILDAIQRLCEAGRTRETREA
jgi:hypothetical protein